MRDPGKPWMRLHRLVPLSLCLLCAQAAPADTREWQEIQIHPDHPAYASSELVETLGGRQVRYPAANAVDGDPATCWVEAVEGPGAGEWLLLRTGKGVVGGIEGGIEALEITNGFAASSSLFTKNNRPRRIELVFIPAFTAPGMVTELDYEFYFGRVYPAAATVELEDTPLPQRVTPPWSLDEQEEMIVTTLDEFFTDYERLARHIEKALGYSDTSELAGRNLALFLRDVRERFLQVFIRIVIVDVYPGSTYDDTCLTEVRLIAAE